MQRSRRSRARLVLGAVGLFLAGLTRWANGHVAVVVLGPGQQPLGWSAAVPPECAGRLAAG